VSNDDNESRDNKRRLKRTKSSEGEGLERDESVEIVETEDKLELALSAHDFPFPDRHYSADVAGVHAGDEEVDLLFGQIRPVTGTLYTLAAITYSESAFDSLLDRTRDFYEGLRTNSDVANEPSQYDFEPTAIDELSENNLYKDRATFEQMAYHGEDGEIVFYFLSPSGVQTLQKRKDASRLVSPLLSISLSSSVLLGLLEDIYSLEE